MSSEQVIEQVLLHRTAVLGRIVTLAFDGPPDGAKVVRLDEDGEIVGEYDVEVSKLADGRHAIEVESVNKVGWKKVEWLIERLREVEAQNQIVRELVGCGPEELDAWKERLRQEGEARFMTKAQAMIGKGDG